VPEIPGAGLTPYRLSERKAAREKTLFQQSFFTFNLLRDIVSRGYLSGGGEGISRSPQERHEITLYCISPEPEKDPFSGAMYRLTIHR